MAGGESFNSSTMARIEGQQSLNFITSLRMAKLMERRATDHTFRSSLTMESEESESETDSSSSSSMLATMAREEIGGYCCFISSSTTKNISICEREIYSTKLRLFTVTFFGTPITVTVTSTPAIARRWIHVARYFSRYYYYSNRLVAGIGVQWVPNSRSRSSPAATLQICVGRRCLIYQLAHAARVPMALQRFLQSPAVTLVGIWNHSDAKRLRMSRHCVVVRELIDLRHRVRRENGESMARASMEEIVEEWLGHEGVSVDPRISRSKWDDEILSFDQVRQATVDAYVSFEIGKKIEAWSFCVTSLW